MPPDCVPRLAFFSPALYLPVCDWVTGKCIHPVCQATGQLLQWILLLEGQERKLSTEQTLDSSKKMGTGSSMKEQGSKMDVQGR